MPTDLGDAIGEIYSSTFPFYSIIFKKWRSFADIMHRALQCDTRKNYTEALKLYEIGIEHFLDALHRKNINICSTKES